MLGPSFPVSLPTGRSGRVTALCLLSAILIAFAFGLVIPLVDTWNDLDDEFEALKVRARGYERLMERRSAIAAQLATMKEHIDERPDYLPVAEPAVVAANAQADLSSIAESTGAIVRSTLTLPPVVADGFTAIGFQISVTGSMRSIRDLLYAIEGGKPRFVVDRLVIGPSQQQDAVEGDVDMALDLHGYMLGEIEQ